MNSSLLLATVAVACVFQARRLGSKGAKLSISSLMSLSKKVHVGEMTPNPHHKSAFDELKRTLERLSLFDEKQVNTYMSAVKHASYLCTDASLEDLTTYSMFQWFTLSFDDLLEKDEAYYNVEKRNLLIDTCIEAFRSGKVSTAISDLTIPNSKAFVDFFLELRSRCIKSMGDYSKVWIPRFSTTIHDWLYKGSVPAMDYLHVTSYHGIEQVLNIRRYDINILQIFDLQELVQGVRIPEEVYTNCYFQEMRLAQADSIALINDLLSYGKEKSVEYPFNSVIAVEKEKKCSANEAASQMIKLTQERVDKFLKSEAALMKHLEENEASDNLKEDVRKYTKGMKIILQAAIGFSLKSGRYNHPMSLFQELQSS